MKSALDARESAALYGLEDLFDNEVAKLGGCLFDDKDLWTMISRSKGLWENIGAGFSEAKVCQLQKKAFIRKELLYCIVPVRNIWRRSNTCWMSPEFIILYVWCKASFICVP